MEKIEITDEMIEAGMKCTKKSCPGCTNWKYRTVSVGNCIEMFSIALKSERAERAKNPGVWDGAPEKADKANVNYFCGDRILAHVYSKSYTRELPKTKAREIAERWASVPTPTPTRPYLADIIESAILEAQAQKN